LILPELPNESNLMCERFQICWFDAEAGGTRSEFFQLVDPREFYDWFVLELLSSQE
jgi:hypothetical protein